MSEPTSKKFSRRTFLFGAGVGAGALALGLYRLRRREAVPAVAPPPVLGG